MNIILMLIGVVIVYNILRITYRDNWSRNLSVDVTFSSNTATKGDTIKMVETVTNAKRMPLPCVNIKFSIDKNLVFGLIPIIPELQIRLTATMYFHFFLTRG